QILARAAAEAPDELLRERFDFDDPRGGFHQPEGVEEKKVSGRKEPRAVLGAPLTGQGPNDPTLGRIENGNGVEAGHGNQDVAFSESREAAGEASIHDLNAVGVKD